MSATTQGTDPADLGTSPDHDSGPAPVGLGFGGWMRWVWRQLTSMRTALLLLFLLAIASIPGSILPQRPVDPGKVSTWISDNPGWGEFFNRIGFFDVFAAPWYVAIYLLLCVSLIGCIVPRTRLHWQAMRAQPPRTPSRLSRLPEWREGLVSGSDHDPTDVLTNAAAELKKNRWRIRVEDFDGTQGSVSAEKGYLRETGNLLFHVSLLALLVGVAFGGMYGWRGQALVIEGESFTDTITQYDSFRPGGRVDTADLPPFSFTLNDFSATFQEGGEQAGAPRGFEADVTVRSEPGAAPEQQLVQVNQPLIVDGAKAFLVGHGYAPVIVVKDKDGTVIHDAATPFLQVDANFTSNGVIKMPDAQPQLALQGIFAPTATIDNERGPHSTFPAANDPAVFLSAFQGNLGLDNGIPQNVYRLDTTNLERLGIKGLRVGETWELPNGVGSVSFVGLKEYAVFDVAHDPGKEFALVAAVLAILGLMLSLFVPRRRVWVKVSTADDDQLRWEVAGLARNEDVNLASVVDSITETALPESPPEGDADADRG